MALIAQRNIFPGILPLVLTIGALLPSPSHAKGPPYRLDSGDVLAVIVDGVLGDFGSAPVHMPRSGDDTLPAIGYPTLVLRDGTIVLPIIDPVFVRGLSVTEAKKRVSTAYRVEKILRQDNRVSLTLMRKRTINVTVVHDAANASIRQAQTVRLPADRSNVLGALVESKSFDPRASIHIHSARGPSPGNSHSSLSDHDIVQLHSQPSGHFYTGGRLAGGEFPMPRSRQPNALQAIAVAGGMPRSRFFGPSQVIVVPPSSRPHVMSYGVLQNNPTAVPIQPGDTIIVR